MDWGQSVHINFGAHHTSLLLSLVTETEIKETY